MARIRTIKPEFWSHPQITRLTDTARLLALALLNLSDDEGYFRADPALVRNFARPFDADTVSTHGALTELSLIGFIEVREHASHGRIGRVVAFVRHQRINRPTASGIAKYFQECAPDSVSTHGGLTEDSHPEGKGREGKGTGNREGEIAADAAGVPETQKQPDLKAQQDPKASTTADERTVFEYWKQARKKRDDVVFSDQRRAKIRARLREKFSVEKLCRAIDGVAFDTWEDRPKHDDLDVLLRDAGQVEKFLSLHPVVVTPLRHRPANPTNPLNLPPADPLRAQKMGRIAEILAQGLRDAATTAQASREAEARSKAHQTRNSNGSGPPDATRRGPVSVPSDSGDEDMARPSLDLKIAPMTVSVRQNGSASGGEL